MDDLAPDRRIAADASAGRDEGHSDDLVASGHDFPSAKDHDFQKALAAMAALGAVELVTKQRDAWLLVDSVVQAMADAERREHSSAKERAQGAKADRAEARLELWALRRQVALRVLALAARQVSQEPERPQELAQPQRALEMPQQEQRAQPVLQRLEPEVWQQELQQAELRVFSARPSRPHPAHLCPLLP
ncbi:MAG TPA: hypothetical protein VNX66_08615 [Candidatus Sulfotelmatobacter sp.]|jgi:hypothetical protein|nr:hypothetical protein [Candidatus Sulfotelmatobacter sp.]